VARSQAGTTAPSTNSDPAVGEESALDSARTVILEGSAGRANGMANGGATLHLPSTPSGNGAVHAGDGDVETLGVVTGPAVENGARPETSDA
jgi:hypothetical protein